MRTTVTFEPDVVPLVEEAMHRERKSMKQIVNEALRRALSDTGSRPPYVVKAHHARLRPGLDPAGFNRLPAELEDEELAARRQVDPG